MDRRFIGSRQPEERAGGDVAPEVGKFGFPAAELLHGGVFHGRSDFEDVAGDIEVDLVAQVAPIDQGLLAGGLGGALLAGG